MRNLLYSLMLSAALPIFAQQPISLKWTTGEESGDGSRLNHLTIINNSADTIRAPWQLYYGSQSPVLVSRTPIAEAVQICGTHHAIRSLSDEAAIAPGDSLALSLSGYYFHNLSFFPENPYLIAADGRGGSTWPIRIDLQYREADHREMAGRIDNYPDGPRTYERNARFTPSASLSPYHIIPEMKSVSAVAAEGPCVISGAISVKAPETLSKEKKILEEMLRRQGVRVDGDGATAVALEIDGSLKDGDESYRMSIRPGGIVISAPAPAGVFLGGSSLLAILAGQTFPLALEAADIEDRPDFGYRGLHFDAARNFTGKEDIKKIIDLMTLYKMNVLHFHLVDDEGWRLAIDGIDELTETGSRRTYAADAASSLVPAYGSGIDGGKSGNGFYSRDEFKDILRYAADRNIRVIPEIELPGHARAAIMAMNRRHERYKDSDPAKAEEYLLADFDDRSEYTSAQDYHDCVINIALPSAFNFVRDVMADIIRMYAEAGAPLEVIHVGGDEVAAGAWEGSPAALKYMKEKGMESTQELRDEFLMKIQRWLEPQGIAVAGWQDIVTRNGGKEVNTSLPVEKMISYSWNTQPYGDMDQMTYSMVNAGCPTVLCNVNNLYMDLAYSANVMDGGLHWGGYVNEFATFATNPYDIYASAVNPDDPQSWNPEASSGKVRLDPAMAKNILGVQGQMWAETYRDFDMVTERMMPKLLGVAERGWNARPRWNSFGEFMSACSDYASRTALNEFGRASMMGISYHVAPPGLKMEGALLLANSPYPNATIRYTLDNTEPDENSPLWTEPVRIGAETEAVKARSFINGRASVTTELFLPQSPAPQK